MKKIFFFVFFYLVLYNVVFLIFLPEIYANLIIIILLVEYFIIGFVDTMLRPLADEKKGLDKYDLVILLLYIFNPFVTILLYLENKLIIKLYFPMLNNIFIALFGLFVFVVAGLITIIARYQLGAFGSGSLIIQEHHQLITKGLYHYIRHPLYAGGILGSLASCLALRAYIGTIIYVAIFFIIFNVRAKKEESLLLQTIQNQYIDYMKHTKRFIPFIY